MARVVLVASLLLTLASATAADAKCAVCIESLTASTTDGTPWSLGKTMTLTVTASSPQGADLPATGVAVIMQVDGSATKCINVSLYRSGQSGGIATYTGSFTPYKHAPHSGRIDIGGTVHEFTLALNGEPATLREVSSAAPALVAPQSGALVRAPQASAAAAPVVRAPEAPIERAYGGGASAPAIDLSPLAERPTLLLAAALAVLIAGGTYADRMRARRSPPAA